MVLRTGVMIKKYKISCSAIEIVEDFCYLEAL